jgi:alpha-tubulin suppressor-like RCC1 family protein
LSDQTVWCWGDNSYAQLGEASTATFEPAPVKLPSFTGAVALGAGLLHSCAIFADATARCWGDNGYGELGNGILTNIATVAGGWDATCAGLKDGTVQCWGNNTSGQLGVVLSSGDRTSVPHTVPNLSSVTAVAMGWSHSCALLADRSVKCWGDGSDGQLGNAQSGYGASSTSPVQVGSLSGVVELSAGRSTTCAVLDDGSLKCWGENGWGQVSPIMDGGPQSTPVAVDLGGKVKAVTTNGGHTCALTLAGLIQCWGNNDKYQLGSTDSYVQFTTVTGLPNSTVTSLSAGSNHTCAVLGDGSAWCWGANDTGQLGAGSSTTKSATPVKVKL